MKRKFILCAFLLCGLAFFFFAGCGVFDGDEKTPIPPSETKDTPDPSLLIDAKIREFKGSRYGQRFDKTDLYYEMRTGAVGDTLEQLGERYIVPGILDFQIGDSAENAGALPILAFVCGSEAAMPNPKMFLSDAAVKASVEYGLTDEEISALSPASYVVSISARLGSELRQVALTNPMRTHTTFVVVEVPQGVGVTLAQQSCSFPRGDYKALELLDTVYFMNGPRAGFRLQDGYEGFMPVSLEASDFIEGIFPVIAFSGEVLLGTIVLGLMDGHPQVLGMVIQQDPETGMAMVMSINLIFPEKN